MKIAIPESEMLVLLGLPADTYHVHSPTNCNCNSTNCWEAYFVLLEPAVWLMCEACGSGGRSLELNLSPRQLDRLLDAHDGYIQVWLTNYLKRDL